MKKWVIETAKVVVLGLDGATWKILDPLVKAGLLPYFQRILRHGCTAFLDSTVPPTTSPAWPSMATGLNPGKLGVYSTLMRSESKSFSLKPVNSSAYRGRALWDLLSENRFRVAVFKIPFLYPVYKVNGYMVSGFGSASKFAAYPSYLYRKLVSGPTSLLEVQLFKSLQTLNPTDAESSVRFINQLKMLVQKERKIVLESLRTVKWDFLFYVVSPTDWLQHAFMDRIIRLVKRISSENSYEQDTTDKAIIDFYKEIDILVGEFSKLVEQTGEDFLFFIVSDHGFTTRPYTFNLAKWLIRNGYMKIRSSKKKYETSLKSILVEELSNLSKDAVSGQILEAMFRVLPGSVLQKLKKTHSEISYKTSISEYVDLDRSRIFCLEDHGIYVNPSERDTRILDKMILELNKFLKQFPDLILKTFKSCETYWGDKIQLSPDLIISIIDRDQIWEISTNPTKPLVFKPSLPGIHDKWGIFFVYGSQIKQGMTLNKVSIFDVCPTVLHFFGIPIPSNIDGRALKEVFGKKVDTP